MTNLHRAFTQRQAVWSDIADHLTHLYCLALTRPHIIELGTRGGYSTSAFLAAAAMQNPAGHVWSVDIAPADVPPDWQESPLWSFAQCDDLSAQAQAFLPQQCHMLFIDTSHTFEQTLAELRLYAPRVHRAGGVIACHDTQWDEGDISLPVPGGPVTEALDVYCAEAGLAWVNRHSEPGYYGLGVIYP